jgi:serine/threonine protein kinase
MSDLLGQSIGRYHIVEQLGEGGMATVYKAYDTRLERYVAIKFIRSDVVRDDTFQRRFEREAKALASLSHPNIVKVLDYGEHEGVSYLVMEYISGGTMKSLMGKVMPWQDAFKLIIPIARTLDYTHQRGIIHRDVKPSNFLISDSGEPMLSDFGIAKLVAGNDNMQLTGTGVGIGTPEYMAPEQGLGQAVDGRADIYSLGVVLYELLTGQKPYHADTPIAVLYKHIADPLPSPRSFKPDLPEAVESIVFCSMAKKPVDRYQTMGDFAGAMDKLLREPPTQAQAAPLPPVKAQPDEQATKAYPEPYAPFYTPTPPLPEPVYQSSIPGYHPATQPPVQPAVQPAKKSNRTVITCGIIAAVVICVGAIVAILGFGALGPLFGQATLIPTRTALAEQPSATIESSSGALPTTTPNVTQPTVTAFVVPTATLVTQGSILFQDDFSDTSSGWFVTNDSTWTSQYQNGEYWLTLHSPNWISWVWYGDTTTDVTFNIDARILHSTGDGQYGILCRYQDNDNGDFYGFEISEGGYAGIYRRQNDEYTFLQDWTYSDLIYNNIQGTVHLSVSCTGSNLSLSVNGTEVARASDTTFSSGPVGLIIEDYNTSEFSVAFDNAKAMVP